MPFHFLGGPEERWGGVSVNRSNTGQQVVKVTNHRMARFTLVPKDSVVLQGTRTLHLHRKAHFFEEIHVLVLISAVGVCRAGDRHVPDRHRCDPFEFCRVHFPKRTVVQLCPRSGELVGFADIPREVWRCRERRGQRLAPLPMLEVARFVQVVRAWGATVRVLTIAAVRGHHRRTAPILHWGPNQLPHLDVC